MSTLLLRLASPMQSWGLDSKFERRGTMREPTKSGVIGMLAAAMGRRRDEAIDDLAALRFGVRLDQPGQLLRDFHTAKVNIDKPPYVTERYYLTDAVFVVGLEGDYELLQDLERAIANPAFPLFLGRRSCPPTGRLVLGIRDRSMDDALREEPWQASAWFQDRAPESFVIMVIKDSKVSLAIRRRDLPLSYSPMHRKFAFRYTEEEMLCSYDIASKKQTANSTEHDPFTEVEG